MTVTAVCYYRDNVCCDLRVKTLPKGFQVIITDFDQKTKLLTFHINRDEVDWQKTMDSIELDLGQGEILEIPVRKIKLG